MTERAVGDCHATLAMTAQARDCHATLAMTAQARDCHAALVGDGKGGWRLPRCARNDGRGERPVGNGKLLASLRGAKRRGNLFFPSLLEAKRRGNLFFSSLLEAKRRGNLFFSSLLEAKRRGNLVTILQIKKRLLNETAFLFVFNLWIRLILKCGSYRVNHLRLLFSSH